MRFCAAAILGVPPIPEFHLDSHRAVVLTSDLDSFAPLFDQTSLMNTVGRPPSSNGSQLLERAAELSQAPFESHAGILEPLLEELYQLPGSGVVRHDEV